MEEKINIQRNTLCPRGSGKKYKQCCLDKIDWNQIFKNKKDPTPYLSIRGRNIFFINKIFEALQLDSAIEPKLLMKKYKTAFTNNTVKKIHEAIMEVWPLDTNIDNVLSKTRDDVSGLYIGDYDNKYIFNGIVRHSIYSNKILVVDPFVYPHSMKDEYNPILEPDQYREQTLKNVNFWFSLMPWIDAGIVEIIRTPADFDRKLNWESIQRQQNKFKENNELQKASRESTRELSVRHKKDMAFHDFILTAPNEILEKNFQRFGYEKCGLTSKEFIEHIEKMREEDPNFLEPLAPGKKSGQLLIFSTGANYEIAKITSNLTGSYLVTDIYSRWKEIEIDRQNHNAENKEWAPFAKAFQNVQLKYLNNISLQHALILRKEKRLESLRIFLRKVWKSARSEDLFSENNAKFLAEELTDEIKKADHEWKQIDRDLLKWFATDVILSTGAFITQGYGEFLAAATGIASLIKLAVTHKERDSFQNKFPAAFFMKID